MTSSNKHAYQFLIPKIALGVGFLHPSRGSEFSRAQMTEELIWNSRTQEKEAEKGGSRTTEETTAQHSRLMNTGSVTDRQVLRRRELPADWKAGMPRKQFHPATY